MLAWFTEWRRYRKFWAFLIVGMVWAGVMAMGWKLPGLDELAMQYLGIVLAALAGERIPNDNA
jgi:hypothetical protein